MKGLVLLSVALLIGLVSPLVLAQQRVIVQLSLNEVTPWYSFGKKDRQIINTTVLGALGQPLPIISTTETGYLVDVQTSFFPTSPEYHLETGPVRTGLEAVVIAHQIEYESEGISISLAFSYTAAVDDGEPVVETSTARGRFKWRVNQGQTKHVPFEVDGKKYLLYMKAYLTTEENPELGMNQFSNP